MALRRLRSHAEHGFTLVEMIVVLVLLSILVLIAVPSYLGFSGRAERRTASADVRSAVSSAEAYRADNETYAGMTVAALRGYDQAIAVDDVRVSADGKSYCLDKTVNSRHAYVVRGAAPHTPAASGADAGQVDETGLCPATVDDTSN
ncbi:MAG: prepilin-type N-terminal cleavage/methylation domain-containing protein [Gaiellaceae bacterium]